jgi:hypothetical protein
MGQRYEIVPGDLVEIDPEYAHVWGILWIGYWSHHRSVGLKKKMYLSKDELRCALVIGIYTDVESLRGVGQPILPDEYALLVAAGDKFVWVRQVNAKKVA